MRRLSCASYLSKDRFGTFYFRFTVPKSLRMQRPTLPREIRRSLNTKVEAEAIPQARLMWLELQRQLGALPMNILTHSRQTNETTSAMPGIEVTIDEETEKRLIQSALNDCGLGVIASNVHDIDELRAFHARMKQLEQSLLTSFLNDDQIVLGHLASRSGIATKALPDQTRWIESANPSAHCQMAKDATLLSVRVEQFIERNRRCWEENNLKEVSSLLRIFVEIIGNKSLQTVTLEDANRFIDTIRHLPKNYVLLSKRTGGNLLQLIEKVKGGELEGLKPGAQIKYLRRAAQFIDECKSRGEYSQENYFRRRMVRQKTKEKTKRDFFRREELTTIFANYRLFTDRGRKQTFAPRFWVPLIAVYTGARLNEICQLHASDVFEEEGIWCLRICPSSDGTDRENSKRVKTKASQRKFPIHKTLLDLGFIRFVEQRQLTGDKRLFPELSFNSKNGHGHKVSGWFNAKFLPKIGVKTKRNCFHSFRNTFTTKFRARGGSVGDLYWITGHTERSESNSYVGDLPEGELARLKKEINAVDYGIDLSLQFCPSYNPWVKR